MNRTEEIEELKLALKEAKDKEECQNDTIYLLQLELEGARGKIDALDKETQELRHASEQLSTALYNEIRHKEVLSERNMEFARDLKYYKSLVNGGEDYE